MSSETARSEQADIRILVAFVEDYRAYQDVVGVGIRVLRPHAEVETSSLDALVEHIERFDPELVICSGHEAIHSGGRRAWVELSMDPLQPTRIWVGGRYSERTNPTVDVLLAVIDEVEELIQTNTHSRNC
jgi:hypothetical protein